MDTAWLVGIRPRHMEVDVEPNALLNAIRDELIQFAQVFFTDFALLGVLPNGRIVPICVHEMEAQAIETVLTEPFGELPTILWLWKTSVTRQIRSEKAQRNTTIINEMTVFYTDKSMGTSRFWR